MAEIRLPDGLGGNGLHYFRHRYIPLSEVEISICKIWVSAYCRPRATINNRMGSYHLKHVIEHWSRVVVERGYLPAQPGYHYISNGACIAAFIELGYRYEQQGPNAYFNFQYIGPGIQRQRGDRRTLPATEDEWHRAYDHFAPVYVPRTCKLQRREDPPEPEPAPQAYIRWENCRRDCP